MKIDIRELDRIIVKNKETEESIKRIIRSNKIRRISRRRRVISIISKVTGFSGFAIMVLASGASDSNTLPFTKVMLMALIGTILLTFGFLLYRLLEITNKNNFWRN